MPRISRSGFAFGPTALILALIAFGTLPAWSMSALPVVLVASELSPMLALTALVWLPLCRRMLVQRPVARRATTVLLSIAALVALLPLAQSWAIARRADEELRALGAEPLAFADALGGVPAAGDVRERVVPYAAADGTRLALRLFGRAAGDSTVRPIVVVLYGGAWRSGETTQGARTSRALAARGYLVVAIDYRHAPRFTFPSQLDDVRRSLALVRDSAAAWRGDSSRIALLGRSAGGHLAELAAFAPGDPPVRAVVALYAPWDLAEGYRDLPEPDPIRVRTVIGNFVGGTPYEQSARYRAASPASYVRAGLPATLLVYGARDHLVKPEFNRKAARALRSAGVPVAQIEVPWSEHGFDLVPEGLGERMVWNTLVRFLARELRRKSPLDISGHRLKYQHS